MSITNKLTLTKVVVGILASAMIVGALFSVMVPKADAALTESQIQSILSLLSSFGADQTTINNVNSSLRGQPTSGGSTGGTVSSTACPYTWSVNLKTGSTGADVMQLQKFLNSMSGTQVASTGAGSPGNETSYFGPATGAAVKKFQEMYASEILAPLGLTTGTPNFFASTRAKANALCTGSTGGTTGSTTGSTTTPAPTGTGLAVSSGAQPMNSLAIYNATRVPFTKFMVTAGNDGDVVLNSVTVERKGLGSNAAFAGIVLIDDSTGMQVGISKVLNSDNKATVGSAITIPRGTTKMFTVAGNMETSAGGYDGQQIRLDVVAVNTSATVTGSLPIVGATHTVNESLTIGTVTVARGALDNATNTSKEIGTTGYNFTSIKLTAGSAEDVYVKSVRFENTGTSAAGDVANAVITVDGTEYPAVVADGKYYSAVFPGEGILLGKGNSKDFTIKGDIVGGSNRTFRFEVSKKTDLYAVGKTYGYGITPSYSTNSNDDPWFYGNTVTASAGSITVSAWTAVSAQNIAINQADQPLGGFTVDVRGEPVTVGRLKFNISTTTTYVKNVTLVDQNGSVLAGPIDAASGAANALDFTDSITFPVGMTNITMKGKLSSDWPANGTFAASTTPSSQWTSVTGQSTGKTITTAPSSAITASTMTGKSGALNVTVSSVPIAQTVIAGAQKFVFANYVFDATASGEDLRVTSIPLAFYATGTVATAGLTGCQLWDGSTSVTTGSNIVNPTSAASSTNFTFDGTGLVVTKGTAKTLSLACNVSNGATPASVIMWGLDAGATFSGVTGLSSASSISSSFTENGGQIMTLASGGSLVATLDTSSPSYKIVSAGATGVELARIKFSATNEDIDLKQVALQLNTASSSRTDLVGNMVSLWTTDGVQVATAVFPSGAYATSSQIAAGAFRITKDGSKVLVVKGDIANISNSGPLTASGDLLKVDYDGSNTGVNGNYGTGVSAGANITPTGSDTASQGVRVMAAYPVFETVSYTTPTLVNGTDKVMYRFKVTAVDGDVALYKFTFNFSSTTGPSGASSYATTSAWALYSYTDSGFSTADSTFGGATPGLLNADTPTAVGTGSVGESDVNMLFQSTSGTNRTYVIPSGQSRWFELRGTVSSVESTTGSDTFTVKLLGDAAYPSLTTNMTDASSADSDANDDFIWSPISTTTTNAVGDFDYTNGYLVSGLPTPSMAGYTFTSAN